MRSKGFNRSEAGATLAEFAIVASVFFMVIIGIVELGRLFYTHNALTDAARRGARYAALHKETDAACVKNVVVYGETHVDPNTCAPTGQPLINGLAPANVTVLYQGNAPTPFGMNLGVATVTINYSFTLSIPLFTRTIQMPAYSSTLPAESAGEIPKDI